MYTCALRALIWLSFSVSCILNWNSCSFFRFLSTSAWLLRSWTRFNTLSWLSVKIFCKINKKYIWNSINDKFCLIFVSYFDSFFFGFRLGVGFFELSKFIFVNAKEFIQTFDFIVAGRWVKVNAFIFKLWLQIAWRIESSIGRCVIAEQKLSRVGRHGREWVGPWTSRIRRSIALFFFN